MIYYCVVLSFVFQAEEEAATLKAELGDSHVRRKKELDGIRKEHQEGASKKIQDLEDGHRKEAALEKAHADSKNAIIDLQKKHAEHLSGHTDRLFKDHSTKIDVQKSWNKIQKSRFEKPVFFCCVKKK